MYTECIHVHMYVDTISGMMYSVSTILISDVIKLSTLQMLRLTADKKISSE